MMGKKNKQIENISVETVILEQTSSPQQQQTDFFFNDFISSIRFSELS